MITCNMVCGCAEPVTHIGEKGYTYCALHVVRRTGVERCRILRSWEIRALNSGQLLSYRYKSKHQHMQDRAYAGLDNRFNAALATITRDGK